MTLQWVEAATPPSLSRLFFFPSVIPVFSSLLLWCESTVREYRRRVSILARLDAGEWCTIYTARVYMRDTCTILTRCLRIEEGTKWSPSVFSFERYALGVFKAVLLSQNTHVLFFQTPLLWECNKSSHWLAYRIWHICLELWGIVTLSPSQIYDLCCLEDMKTKIMAPRWKFEAVAKYIPPPKKLSPELDTNLW